MERFVNYCYYAFAICVISAGLWLANYEYSVISPKVSLLLGGGGALILIIFTRSSLVLKSNLLLLACLVGVLEITFYFMRPGGVDITVVGGFSRKSIDRSHPIGFHPKPDQTVYENKRRLGETIFDVTYHTDEHGHRLNPVSETDSVNRFALFFGGSYTFRVWGRRYRHLTCPFRGAKARIPRIQFRLFRLWYKSYAGPSKPKEFF